MSKKFSIKKKFEKKINVALKQLKVSSKMGQKINK